jgi:hypothetical protein
MTEDTIITVEHIREAGMCVRGAKQWFALHGLNFQDFLLHGIPASKVTSLGDVFADKVVALARGENE